MASESYPQGLFVRAPDATELILVRHGASAAAVPGEPFELIEGESNPRLSPEGEAQARAVADRLAREPVAGVFISTLDRTAADRRSVDGALTGLEPVVLADLREVHVGELEGGRFRIAFADRDPVIVRLLAEQRWEVIPAPRPSCTGDPRARGGRAGRRRRRPGSAAVVVTHGGVIAELCRQATAASCSRPARRTPRSRGSWSGRRWLAAALYNDTTHLAAAAAGPPCRRPR